MTASLLEFPAIRCALICMEVPLDRTGAPVELPKIYGKPAIFHQVKHLQRLGVRDIIISVDAVPAELPNLIERLNGDGAFVRLMRTNSGVDAPVFDHPFLLIAQDLWIADDLLRQVLRWPVGHVGILQEDSANHLFERIDLNRRWSGLAVLDSSMLQNRRDMPDDWNLASFLLRNALQSNAKELAIDQRHITETSLVRIAEPSQYESLFAKLFAVTANRGILERRVNQLCRQMLGSVTSKNWLTRMIGWGPVALGVTSAGLVYAGFIVAAFAVLMVALCVEELRQQLRETEYAGTSTDGLKICTYILATIILGIALWQNGVPPFDAALLIAMTFGLIYMLQTSVNGQIVSFFSPLALGMGLLAGAVLGLLAIFTKLGIGIMLVALVRERWLDRRNSGQLNSN